MTALCLYYMHYSMSKNEREIWSVGEGKTIEIKMQIFKRCIPIVWMIFCSMAGKKNCAMDYYDVQVCMK